MVDKEERKKVNNETTRKGKTIPKDSIVIEVFTTNTEKWNLIIHIIACIIIPIFYVMVYSKKMSLVTIILFIITFLAICFVFLGIDIISFVAKTLNQMEKQIPGSTTIFKVMPFFPGVVFRVLFEWDKFKFLQKAFYIVVDLVLLNMIVFASSTSIYNMIHGNYGGQLDVNVYVKIHGIISFVVHLVYLCLARKLYALSKNVLYVVFFAVYIFSVLFAYLPEFIQQEILTFAYFDQKYILDGQHIINYHFPPIKEAILSFIIIDTTNYLDKREKSIIDYINNENYNRFRS